MAGIIDSGFIEEVYMEFRHELKFIASDAQLEQIRYRIAHLMQIDKNQKGDFYTITSLYFDDINDRCVRENIDGVDLRHKYRIRIYENSLDCIKLEKKSKINGMTKKVSANLTPEDTRLLMDGDNPWREYGSDTRKMGLLMELFMQGMLPKSIVEYDRTAFVNPVGNVRVTFDRNLRGSLDVAEFTNGDRVMIPLIHEGVHVLEVKYDEFLPRYIYDALEIDSLQQTSFSKYGYSRII